MHADSFYRRPLPAHHIPFSSAEGRHLFQEALLAGFMNGYFPLAEQYHTQTEPTFCGLGTLVIILNALAIDPGRIWRGPWRWYSEELLDCCRPLDVVRKEGLILEDFACLARCNGATAELHRPPDATLDEFRQHLLRAAGADEGLHLVVAYDRGALGQTGSGHYSPVGGYHADRDLVLLLDVARFKYPPHWVPLPALYQAMHALDPATGRPRGYVLLGRGDTTISAMGCVSCQGQPFSVVLGRLRTALAAVPAGEAPRSPEQAVSLILRHLPEEVADLLDLYLDTLGGQLAPQHRALLGEIVQGLRQTELFRLVNAVLAEAAQEGAAVRRWVASRSAPAERAALLLLALPEGLFDSLPGALRAQMRDLRAPASLPPTLCEEIARLRGQMEELGQRCCQ